MSEAHWSAKLADLKAGGPERTPVVLDPAARDPAPRILPYALSLAQAAEYLSVSQRQVQIMVSDGRLPSFHIGSRHLIARLDLEAFVDEACAKAGYTLRLPQNLSECLAAASVCRREADILAVTGNRATDAAHRAQCLQASIAFRRLSTWFRWNAGEDVLLDVAS